MRPRISSALLACGATLSAGEGALRPASSDMPADRPNVILIVTDDQGYGDFGFTGNPVVQTPNLDRMARASARLSRFYVSPVCAPTRASLMTGRYHSRTGVVRNGYPMRPEEVTVAEALRGAGYATGIFGKWHLGDHFPHRPGDQGFEESLVARGGIIGQLEPDPVVVKYTDPTLEHNGRVVSRTGFATDVYFDAACAWIRTAHESHRNFFATIATNAPHRPYDDVPEELRRRYAAMDLTPALGDARGDAAQGDGKERLDELARVYALVTKIDQNVGKLFGLLEELDLVDDTLVLFLCDNGPSEPRFNAGLAGGKASLREGGIRSPFLAHWPGRLAPGVASDRIALHVDVAPTILEACGVDAAGPARDGRSLLALLRREPGDWPDRTVFFQTRFDDDLRRDRSFAVRTQRWKLLVGDLADEAALYDLDADPFEALDVADEHPETVAELRRAYELWLAESSNEQMEEPAVLIGASEENPVLLSHHRWALVRERPRNLSHWDVEVAETGDYSIRFLFPPASVSREARLRAFRMYTTAVEKGARDCLFRRIRLRRGRLRIGALVSPLDGKPEAVWQIEVRRL